MPAGRPKGSGNKAKAAARSRAAKSMINPDAAPKGYDPEFDFKGARCTCCGKYYEKKKGNFPHSNSPLFASNEQYFTVCKRCVNKYFGDLTAYFTGNEEKAIERLCQITDWFYDDRIWADTSKVVRDASRVDLYPSTMQLVQWKRLGTTYLDTVRLRASDAISSLEQLGEMKDAGKTTASRAQVLRWGPGFSDTEYDVLDGHYKSLRDIINTDDVIQDNLARDLCEIKVQQIRARNQNDADNFQKFTKLYQDTLRSANLRVKSSAGNAVSDDHACWGSFIRDVENYVPAEIYEDRGLFRDVDKIGDYLNRFVLRPVKNFFLGTSEMDPECNVGGDPHG